MVNRNAPALPLQIPVSVILRRAVIKAFKGFRKIARAVKAAEGGCFGNAVCGIFQQHFRSLHDPVL